MRPARFERSREVVESWWKRTFGIRSAMPVMDNGSGLSREERITADGLLALLRDAASHPSADMLRQSLPVAGVDGTAARMGQRGVMKLALGNARIKTGSLRDVVDFYVTRDTDPARWYRAPDDNRPAPPRAYRPLARPAEYP